MIRALQYVWSAPWGLVGLLVELLFRALGWVELRDGREMVVSSRFAMWLRGRGWLATTIGWSVFYWQDEPRYKTQRHERRHVQQCLRWGLLFPFAYLACLLFQGYRNNFFEVDARRYAAPDAQGGIGDSFAAAQVSASFGGAEVWDVRRK